MWSKARVWTILVTSSVWMASTEEGLLHLGRRWEFLYSWNWEGTGKGWGGGGGEQERLRGADHGPGFKCAVVFSFG